MKIPGPRDLYDAVERQLEPRLEQLVRTDNFNDLAALIAKVRSGVEGRVNSLNERLLHLVNLPAGTDIQKLHRQVGELDREVRLLRLQLAEERKKGVSADGGTTKPAQRSRARKA